MTEEWRPIAGYEGLYEVSNEGRVRSLDRLVNSRWGLRLRRGRVLKPCQTRDGYFRVVLNPGKCPQAFLVHCLVATAFHGKRPDRYQCNHIDGRKTNNVPANLCWVTASDNRRHDFRVLKTRDWRGGKHPHAKLVEADAREIRRLRELGLTYTEIASRFAINKTTARNIGARISWTHVA